MSILKRLNPVIFFNQFLADCRSSEPPVFSLS